MSKEPAIEQLLALARRVAPSDAAPYLFEKRIMARLSALQPVDILGLWAGSLWKAAASCIAIMILFSIWTFLPLHAKHSPGRHAAGLEETVLGDVDVAPDIL